MVLIGCRTVPWPSSSFEHLERFRYNFFMRVLQHIIASVMFYIVSVADGAKFHHSGDFEQRLLKMVERVSEPISSTENWDERFQNLVILLECHFPYPPSGSLVQKVTTKLSALIDGELPEVLVARKCTLQHLVTQFWDFSLLENTEPFPLFCALDLETLLNPLSFRCGRYTSIKSFGERVHPFLVFLLDIMHKSNCLVLPVVNYMRLERTTRQYIWSQYRSFIDGRVSSSWAIASLYSKSPADLVWFRRMTGHWLAQSDASQIPAFLTYALNLIFSAPITHSDGEWQVGRLGDALVILIELFPDFLPDATAAPHSLSRSVHNPQQKNIAEYIRGNLQALKYFLCPSEPTVNLPFPKEQQLQTFDLFIFLTKLQRSADFDMRSQWIHDHLLRLYKDQPESLLMEAYDTDSHHLIGTLLRAPLSSITPAVLDRLSWTSLECHPRSFATILAHFRQFMPTLPSQADMSTRICHRIADYRASGPPSPLSPCAVSLSAKLEPIVIELSLLDDMDTACLLIRIQMYFVLGVPLEFTREIWDYPYDKWEPVELFGMANVLLDRYCQLTKSGQPRFILVKQSHPNGGCALC